MIDRISREARPSPGARPARGQAHRRPLTPPVAVWAAVCGGVAVLPRRRDRAPWAGGGPRGGEATRRPGAAGRPTRDRPENDPSIRKIFRIFPYLSGYQHFRPSKPGVAGSNPAGRATFLEKSPIAFTFATPSANVQRTE